MDYSGKIIKKTPVTPSQTSASGVWTLDDAVQAQKTNTWPVANVPNPISRSLRFRSSASAYLNRTFSSTGNQKTFTQSYWVKRGTISVSNNLAGTDANASLDYAYFRFNSTDNLMFYSGTGSTQANLVTTAVYRDPSAWYHIVVAVDTTQATDSNRVKIYVNGTQVTSFTTATYPSQNADLKWNNSTYPTVIGTWSYVRGSDYFDGYMTEVNFIDGQALDPTYFGGTNSATGVWEPRQYTGTYGTNGFYLNFKDNTSTTTLGYDYSGNSNNWTTNNISLTAGSTYDSMLDVPTQWIGYNTGDVASVTRGNYATLNPLVASTNSSTTSNGNLQLVTNSSGGAGLTTATIGVSSGKWYWEQTTTVDSISAGSFAGIISSTSATTGYVGSTSQGWGYYNSGSKYNNNSGTSYGASWGVNDVIGVALDMDAGTITFYKNNTSQGTAFTGLSGTMFPAISDGGTGAITVEANFGQRPFSYTPPSGYLPLCTTNLSSPTILQGNQYFDATTYTGTGSTQSIVNSGAMQPDMVWLKIRSSADSHTISDSVRGISGTGSPVLFTNTTGAEATFTGYGVSALNSNGFTLIGNGGLSNASGSTYVGWQWKGGGTGVTNTAGSITSTVSANTTSGFSVVTYTGNGLTGASATVGHGLGVAPKMLICKKRSSTGNWITYHTATGVNQYLYLNSTAAAATSTPTWGVSSTTVTFQQPFGDYNDSGVTYVMYAFSEVAGFSKFGSYTGNGSTDGPFIYTGFRPRYIMTKVASSPSTDDWLTADTARFTYNVVNMSLAANLSNAESYFSGNNIDILSNGFKIRNSGNPNTNGATYIYMAFAENPFKNALAR